MRILFVTWDGPQVSYLESLFLPIFKKLAVLGFEFHVLQLTWGEPDVSIKRKQMCLNAGVNYHPVSIFRRPVSIGPMISGFLSYKKIRKYIDEKNIDVVMPRSPFAALPCLIAQYKTQCKFLYDADGLPLDERVDFAGRSPSGMVYRFLRDIEAQAVRRADVVLTRSAKAADILQARAGAGTNSDKFHVVTNGREITLFNPGNNESRAAMRTTLGLMKSIPLLVYAGSIGPQYCVPQMLRLFELIRLQHTEAQLLVLTGSADVMQELLQEKPDLAGNVTVKSVASEEVPDYLACADLGLAFRQPTFSMQGVAPIKLGEYLLCGLPLVATQGIGDTHNIDATAGFMVDKMDESELQAVAEWFTEKVLPAREELREHCRQVGLAHFSLEASAASYQQALAALAQE